MSDSYTQPTPDQPEADDTNHQLTCAACRVIDRVSLEAIFLATFGMISQNRQAARADLRSQLDFENHIRGEIWSVHIGEALGLDVEHVEDIVRRTIDGAQAAMRNAPTTAAKTPR
jgi:uncharacterized membrane protein